MSQRDYFEKDYYVALGVATDASQADIAKAYRRLARELHPDANPWDKSAEERFKQVSEAYSVLSNPEKRTEYDEVRRLVASGGYHGFGGGRGTAGPRAGGRPGGGYSSQGFADFDLGDLLGGLFDRSGNARGGGGARGAGRRGRDVETDLTLAFSDALQGVTTTLRLSGAAPCSTCRGSGAKPGTSPVPCSSCGGAGTIAHDQGMFSFSEPCPACGGSGRQIPHPCPGCRGSGVESRTREIRTRIPAGVKDGATIKLKGKGEPGRNGGPAGDLLVKVHVQAHSLYGRRGDDLTLRVPITLSEAALGAKVTVPTMDGPVTLKVPPATESGKTFRVRGKGVERGAKRGDLLVTVDIAVPRKVTREQRKLLEQLGQTFDGEDVRAHLTEALG